MCPCTVGPRNCRTCRRRAFPRTRCGLHVPKVSAYCPVTKALHIIDTTAQCQKLTTSVLKLCLEIDTELLELATGEEEDIGADAEGLEALACSSRGLVNDEAKRGGNSSGKEGRSNTRPESVSKATKCSSHGSHFASPALRSMDSSNRAQRHLSALILQKPHTFMVVLDSNTKMNRALTGASFPFHNSRAYFAA